jgi:hypothetical protein
MRREMRRGVMRGVVRENQWNLLFSRPKYSNLHNCEICIGVNCAIFNEHLRNDYATRTMKPPPSPATMLACGCKNLGADILHLLQRATGNGSSAELQSQLGSGLCSISTALLTSFWFLLFLCLREPATSQGWRCLLSPHADSLHNIINSSCYL